MLQTEEQTLLHTIILECLLFIVYVPIRVYGHIFQQYAILFPFMRLRHIYYDIMIIYMVSQP